MLALCDYYRQPGTRDWLLVPPGFDRALLTDLEAVAFSQPAPEIAENDLSKSRYCALSFDSQLAERAFINIEPAKEG